MSNHLNNPAPRTVALDLPVFQRFFLSSNRGHSSDPENRRYDQTQANASSFEELAQDQVAHERGVKH